jgi:hypothetical protein
MLMVSVPAPGTCLAKSGAAARHEMVHKDGAVSTPISPSRERPADEFLTRWRIDKQAALDREAQNIAEIAARLQTVRSQLEAFKAKRGKS